MRATNQKHKSDANRQTQKNKLNGDYPQSAWQQRRKLTGHCAFHNGAIFQLDGHRLVANLHQEAHELHGGRVCFGSNSG
jgi:hypothetical protein